MTITLDITLGNIITIIMLIVSLVGTYYKLDKRIDMNDRETKKSLDNKTDKEITINQSKAIELSLERLYGKIANIESTLKEIKDAIEDSRDNYSNLKSIVDTLKAEHEYFKGKH